MRSIAVVIDGSDNDEGSLQVAVACARAADARLTVYHNVMPAILATGTYDMAIATIDNSARVDAARQRARTAFDREAASLPRARFVEVEAALADVLELASPYHDVLLMERLSSGEGPDAVAFNTALWDLRSAVLLMPPQPVTAAIRRVALAWNGSPQAGRALRAALPLIEQGDELIVLSRAGSERDAELDVYLDVHGLKAATWRTYGDPSLSARGWARELLAEVGELGADLLVMGAYGGTFGGLFGVGRATSKVATAARIPVLFSA